jgi:hypothetical protein
MRLRLSKRAHEARIIVPHISHPLSTCHAVIRSGADGSSIARRSPSAAGSSPSQAGHCAAVRIAGMR